MQQYYYLIRRSYSEVANCLINALCRERKDFSGGLQFKLVSHTMHWAAMSLQLPPTWNSPQSFLLFHDLDIFETHRLFVFSEYLLIWVNLFLMITFRRCIFSRNTIRDVSLLYGDLSFFQLGSPIVQILKCTLGTGHWDVMTTKAGSSHVLMKYT